jgi:hypothetical protein
MFTEIDGWQYLTDRYVFLPTAMLTELPVGYDQVLNLQPMPRQASEGLIEWMTLTPAAERGDAVFRAGLLDVLEGAGLLVRPLPLKSRVHAICEPDMCVVGLAMPVRRDWTPGSYEVSCEVRVVSR